jgi:hypothetical protein
LHLELSAASRVRIIDGKGRVVQDRSLPLGTATLDISSLAEGLYLVEVTGHAVRTARLVIAR